LRVLVIANTAWYLYKFRSELINKLISVGHHVCVACPAGDYSNLLENELNVSVFPITETPRKLVPWRELNLIFDLYKACKDFKPDYCLTFTPRINCYIASLPLKRMNIKLIRNISGLGDSITSSNKIRSKIANYFYRLGNKSRWTFYQNESDFNLGITTRLSQVDRSSILPGSGVNLDLFQYSDKEISTPFRVVCIARLIPKKGYLDFIELAKRFKSNNRLEFHLVGEFTKESGISQTEFNNRIEESNLNYHGYLESPQTILSNSHIFVLPSTYGEGLPRVLLEAAACGCILIAYDNPGFILPL